MANNQHFKLYMKFPDLKLHQYLADLSIEYNLVQHQALFTMEDLQVVKNTIRGIVPKNLFLKADKAFVLVCVLESIKTDLKQLAKDLNVKKIRFASEKELYEQLQIKKGSVSIYCLVHNPNIPVYLDQHIWDAEITSFHPNNNEFTIEVDHNNFAKYWNSLPNPKKIITI
jgi:Ala-tRNA(Pro) deacylase